MAPKAAKYHDFLENELFSATATPRCLSFNERPSTTAPGAPAPSHWRLGTSLGLQRVPCSKILQDIYHFASSKAQKTIEREIDLHLGSDFTI